MNYVVEVCPSIDVLHECSGQTEEQNRRNILALIYSRAGARGGGGTRARDLTMVDGSASRFAWTPSRRELVCGVGREVEARRGKAVRGGRLVVF
jgi:hypothetical protein